METPALSELEKKIQYTFRDKNILIEALSHSSYINEQTVIKSRNNERLEFLGDAVLNLVIGHMLMGRFPVMKEGDLSRMRARLVNETQLAKIARSLDLGMFVLLGKGEIQSNGREKTSILANAYEAVIAAVYTDSDFENAFRIVENCFRPLLDAAKMKVHLNDHKSRLQEVVQTMHQEMPTYSIIEESGPDHDKTFRVEVKAGEIREEGVGKSKKTAEQRAAEKALSLIRESAGVFPCSKKNGLTTSR